MEHLYDPYDGIEEAARVLKKDGVFLGSVPHDKGNLGVGKKADYHQWVFSEVDLYGIFGRYFNSVDITETPYSEKFCDENNVDKELKQWLNWVCKEKK